MAISLFTVFYLTTCKSESAKLSVAACETQMSKPSYFHKALDHLTDVIVHDIFSPPVASRVYVYPCVAAHQTLVQKPNNKLQDLSGKLSELKALSPQPDTSDVSYNLASIYAFLKTGKALIFSEDKFNTYANELQAELDSLGFSKRVVSQSKAFGEAYADYILAWANTDNYKESRSFPKYSLSEDKKEWKPTPPGYMEGIEPHWREIRTMVIDSAEQFKPEPPTKFDLNKSSQFMKETMEVYEAVKDGSEEDRMIASFWDCNPFVINQTGHIMYASKKITPGGHWMGIANIASKKSNDDFEQSVATATYVAIGLFDAFISCWDEKYRSNLVRPETVINENIDEDWIPLLQTPPFPEHTSGHSVISTASASILTALYGDNFNYTDDVEVKYGLPMRNYRSFKEASGEAAISRLYGGIHYMPAITEGVKQGEQVGAMIIKKLNLKNVN